jgi:hypothetical protein
MEQQNVANSELTMGTEIAQSMATEIKENGNRNAPSGRRDKTNGRRNKY